MFIICSKSFRLLIPLPRLWVQINKNTSFLIPLQKNPLLRIIWSLVKQPNSNFNYNSGNSDTVFFKMGKLSYSIIWISAGQPRIDRSDFIKMLYTTCRKIETGEKVTSEESIVEFYNVHKKREDMS